MIVDIIIIAIVILSLIIGRHKGLTVCLVNFFSLIIALVVALMFYKPVGTYFRENTPIGENVKQVIKENLPMNDEELKVEDNSILPVGMKKYINEQAKNANNAKDEAIENISTQLSTEVINIVSFVGIFIIARAILLLVKILSKIINKLPILKQIDHLGGAVIGAIEGVIIVYFAFAVISTISPVFENTAVLEQINNSFIGKAMYNNNIIMNKINNL